MFWKSLFCYLSTTSSFSLCEMFVPIELAKNQQNPVFIVPLHIPPPKVFVGLCKMNPFLEPYFLMKKVPSIATSWTVTHPNFEPKFTHKQLKAMGHQRRPLANRNEGVFSPRNKKTNKYQNWCVLKVSPFKYFNFQGCVAGYWHETMRKQTKNTLRTIFFFAFHFAGWLKGIRIWFMKQSPLKN